MDIMLGHGKCQGSERYRVISGVSRVIRSSMCTVDMGCAGLNGSSWSHGQSAPDTRLPLAVHV